MTTSKPTPPKPPKIRPPKPRPKAKRRTDVGRPPYHPGRRTRVRRETSAGGVAVRQSGEDLFAALLKTEHKKGFVWVLPKGHVEEKDSSVPDAARREVMEEAGISDLSVKDQLGITRFKFQAEDAVVHKTVHYFLMSTNQMRLVPQAEEDILEAKWFPIDEAIRQLEYDTDQEIVRRAKEKITGKKEPRPTKSAGRNGKFQKRMPNKMARRRNIRRGRSSGLRTRDKASNGRTIRIRT